MTSEDDVIRLLEAKIADIEHELHRLKNALAAYCNGTMPPSKSAPATGVLPAIVDICTYLKGRETPVHQKEIIREVSKVRKIRYPSLTNHRSSVWRALEYHVRHHKLIECVDEQGERRILKPLPKRPKGPRNLDDEPGLYEQDNWFVLRPGAEEPRMWRRHSDRILFGQD